MLGERIKERRKAAGLTQTQLGDAVGVRKNTVSDWERGKYKPDIETVADIARVLNTRAVYLLECDDDPEDYDALLETADIPLNVAHEYAGDAESQIRYRRAVDEDVRRESAQRRLSEDGYIKKYRALDEHGKQAVNAIIDVEHARIVSESRDIDRTILFPISELPASAGFGTYLGPDAFDYVRVQEDALPFDAAFGVPARGDSMEPQYHDGDILIVSKQLPALGDIGVFVMEGQGYVKKLGEGELISLNADYQPITIDESIRACGKVVGVLDKSDILA